MKLVPLPVYGMKMFLAILFTSMCVCVFVNAWIMYETCYYFFQLAVKVYTGMFVVYLFAKCMCVCV